MDYNANYYSEDRRVGEQCFFDEKDVYIDFNADLKNFLVTPGTITSDYGRSTGMCDLQAYHTYAEPLRLELVFYVGGPSAEATLTNVAGLMQAARQCVVRKEGDIYEYAAVLVDRNCEDTGVDPYQQVSLSFDAIRRRPLIRKRIEGTASIYNPGNQESGVKISIFPDQEMDMVTVMGITIESLKPGVVYVIDGISGRVTANGVNYFSHTNIIEFPKLAPGKNEIQVSTDVPVEIEYYPIYEA